MGVGARGRVVCGETKERTNDEKERRAVPMMNAALARSPSRAAASRPSLIVPIDPARLVGILHKPPCGACYYYASAAVSPRARLL